jgi:predicted naringenin-chalcone synthase
MPWITTPARRVGVFMNDTISYKVLKNYGNLSSASGFMLAEKDDWTGPTIVVGFGVGFTASAGIMN